MKGKKTAVLIADSTNIRVSMSKNFGPGSRFSYPKFEALYSQDCTFVKKFISGSKSKHGDAFWATLERYNYTVRTYEPKVLMGEGIKKEKQVDASLVAYGTEAIIQYRPDLLIILSGDADMMPLLEKARQYNASIHVWACRGSVSNELRLAADKLHYIDDFMDADIVFFQSMYGRGDGSQENRAQPAAANPGAAASGSHVSEMQLRIKNLEEENKKSAAELVRYKKTASRGGGGRKPRKREMFFLCALLAVIVALIAWKLYKDSAGR